MCSEMIYLSHTHTEMKVFSAWCWEIIYLNTCFAVGKKQDRCVTLPGVWLFHKQVFTASPICHDIINSFLYIYWFLAQNCWVILRNAALPAASFQFQSRHLGHETSPAAPPEVIPPRSFPKTRSRHRDLLDPPRDAPELSSGLSVPASSRGMGICSDLVRKDRWQTRKRFCHEKPWIPECPHRNSASFLRWNSCLWSTRTKREFCLWSSSCGKLFSPFFGCTPMAETWINQGLLSACISALQGLDFTMRWQNFLFIPDAFCQGDFCSGLKMHLSRETSTCPAWDKFHQWNHHVILF